MEVSLIESPEVAACLLQPPRGEILERLRQPGSAAGVARELGLPRQRVTYHVRQLEAHGLVEHVADRRVGNCLERLVQARAQRFLISRKVLGDLGLAPGEIVDRFSSAYLVASASAAAETVTAQREAAQAGGRKLATLTLESQVAFADPAAQAAFAEELTDTLKRLIERYDSDAEGARVFDLRLYGFPAEEAHEQET